MRADTTHVSNLTVDITRQTRSRTRGSQSSQSQSQGDSLATDASSVFLPTQPVLSQPTAKAAASFPVARLVPLRDVLALTKADLASSSQQQQRAGVRMLAVVTAVRLESFVGKADGVSHNLATVDITDAADTGRIQAWGDDAVSWGMGKLRARDIVLFESEPSSPFEINSQGVR